MGVTSKKLKDRLRAHIHKIKRTDRTRTHKDLWVMKLLRRGLKPEINLLQTFSTEEDCFAAERYWVDYFRKVGCDLTNTTAGGRGCFGPSEEARAKMSAGVRRHLAANGPGNGCPVIDQSGKVYASAREASRLTGVCFKHISAIIRGERKQSKGYVFAKYKGPETPLPIPRKTVYHNQRKIIDQHGRIFETVSEAAKFHQFKSHSSITRVLTGKNRTAGGVTFKYFSEDAPTPPPPYVHVPYWTGKKRTHKRHKTER